MMHIFHRWDLVYQWRAENGRDWFKHRKCRGCGAERLTHKIAFFSSIGDAIDLGTKMGVYKAFHKGLE